MNKFYTKQNNNINTNTNKEKDTHSLTNINDNYQEYVRVDNES